MRSPLFILIAAFLGTLLIAQHVSGLIPGRRQPDAVDLVFAQVASSPELGPALAAADRGDSAPLMAWLNASDERQRRIVAGLIRGVAMAAAGLADDDNSAAADAALYRYRHRLAGFVNIPTGSEQIDNEIDNLLAYVLVAGTRTPSAEDVLLAKRLLPRLEKAVARDPTSAVSDTIGCVRFTAGDIAGARAAFDEAVRLGTQELAKSSGPMRKELERAMPLYRARQQAAGSADRRSVERRDDPAQPPRLPLASDAPLPEKS